MSNVVALKVKARTRWERLKADLEVLRKVFLFFWHESFGYHDARVVKAEFKGGRRLLWMECPCGAEWDALEPGEDVRL